MIELSICICTMPTRYPMLARLLRELNQQIHELGAQDKVEILTDDSLKISTGAKRNGLYQKAKGKYLVSVDDDDSVYNYYIQEILTAIKSDPDAVGMNGIMTTDGRYEQKWFISKDLGYCATQHRGSTIYLRFQNHISPIRASIAKQFLFPDQSTAEDYDFASAVHNSGLIKTEVCIGTTAAQYLNDNSYHQISFPMYHYRFLSNKPTVR